MTQWTSIGGYLGRNIEVASCNNFNCTIPPRSLMDSLLLVVLDVRFDDEGSRRRFLSMLIGTTPLAIVLCGQDARFAFDTLIGLLSESSSAKHIMTKLLEERTTNEALKDFLQATWPSEERFDEWKKYSVLLTGELQVLKITKLIECITDN